MFSLYLFNIFAQFESVNYLAETILTLSRLFCVIKDSSIDRYIDKFIVTKVTLHNINLISLLLI